MKKKTVAFIPARGGSKGIPKKNLVDLNGKPLLHYAIDAAKNAEKIRLINGSNFSFSSPAFLSQSFFI